jgi:hypothetical protein
MVLDFSMFLLLILTVHLLSSRIQIDLLLMFNQREVLPLVLEFACRLLAAYNKQSNNGQSNNKQYNLALLKLKMNCGTCLPWQLSTLATI